MSSDNGIYILKTKGVKSEFEYRVVYAMGIDSITIDDDWDGEDLNKAYLPPGSWNAADVVNRFRDCKVFNNHDAAMNEAIRIEKKEREGDYGLPTEYGIVDLDFGGLLFPKQ